MNIFEVLNSGNSRLHEPSLSSILGYFLDSKKNHGLGDTFIRLFLKQINIVSGKEILPSHYLDGPIISDVSLEEPYKIGKKKFSIDIQVSLLDREKNEIHRIIVENKIRSTSASPSQLADYYEAVLDNEPNLKKKKLTFVFLTPKPKDSKSKLSEEFDLLKPNQKSHSKCWLYWNNSGKALIGLFKDLLKQEATGEINPINEYLRHTIKAFIIFADELTDVSSRRPIRFGEDLGDIVDSIEVIIEKKQYAIVRRDSGQIQVYRDGEKVVAKEVLRKVIKKYKIDISNDDTYYLTTRQLGAKILDWLNRMKKV